MWITGSLLLFAGLLIIANHQIWSSGPAVVISLFGWFLGLRGLALLVAPQFLERVAASAAGSVTLIRTGSGVLAFLGLWLALIGWVPKRPGSGA